MGLFQKVLRAGEGKKLKVLEAVVPLVGELEEQMHALSDEQLRAQTAELRGRVEEATERGSDLEDALWDALPEAFAVVREAATRVLGQRHYDVQVMGGAALHLGWVAEMKTGEGKTLVATLPSYLNALAGKGVHLVTVNDYLARRDAEWMGAVHRFLGLDVGVVIPGRESTDDKRRAYSADITYGTNNEFGFDYLRDNMVVRAENRVQRGHFYGIVDEIDSILVDEARTPLIISGRATDAADTYVEFARIVRGLRRDDDYEVDEAKRTVVPTEEGIARVEQALSVENLYDNVNQNFVHQLQAALKAKELFKLDVDYIVADGEVKIVDEFTGRILEGRRWSEGLHQAVEAKENVRIKEENQTLATVTLQNYFRMYDKLAGMTGTAYTEAGEFAHTYALEVVQIPTHMPVVRADQSDLIFKSAAEKFDAVVDDIAERNASGQPVLVGTISVEQSELLSRLLVKRGIEHEVLNAKQHEREANIIAQAGQLHGVTVATNMAGRGVDILLGGNPEGLAKSECAKEGLDPDESPDEHEARYRHHLERYKTQTASEGDKVRELGGLYVLGTERHESRRIDNQLRGRSGRQGDPGESRFYLSLEDELMRLFATGLMNRVMSGAFPDGVPLESRMVTKAVERAQHTVEDRNFEIRKNVLKYDEVMNEQRKIIYLRRSQILEGQSLEDVARESIGEAISRVVATHCIDEPETWNVDDLIGEMRLSFPTTLTADDVRECLGSEEVEQRFVDDALAQYERREEEIGADNLREIERRVMLSVIDQRWREHLYEMDYLKEGINLRAMGQRDPLSEWQREGFDMFEAMMAAISEDFVRYVFHLNVVKDEPAQQAPRRLQYSAAASPVQGSAAIRAAGSGDGAQVPALAAGAPATAPAGMQPVQPNMPRQQEPVRVEKVPGRNEPCYCGSGKKYKLCHGR